MYAVIPVTIDFVNLQYTGKSTLLQMWGHFILSKSPLEFPVFFTPLFPSVILSFRLFENKYFLSPKIQDDKEAHSKQHSDLLQNILFNFQPKH